MLRGLSVVGWGGRGFLLWEIDGEERGGDITLTARF